MSVIFLVAVFLYLLQHSYLLKEMRRSKTAHGIMFEETADSIAFLSLAFLNLTVSEMVFS